jgi:4-hydroxy-tetrahydrodipicolinate synthase
MKHLLQGTGVALVTPFKNGQIDYDALQRIINHVIQGGVEYLVSLGTTGETATLTPHEAREILEFTVATTNQRVPILAGFGGNNTHALQQQIEQANFNGIHAILSASPAYNKPTQEGIFQHYTAIAQVAPRPIVIYNVPGRTASNITPDTLARLAHSNPLFIGVKEASGNITQCMDVARTAPPHFALISGDDPLTLPMCSFGAIGVISVLANVLPQPFTHMVRLCLQQKFAEATPIHMALLDITNLLFTEGNPAGAKAALDILGICSGEVRLPLVPMSPAGYKKMEAALQTLHQYQAVPQQ